MRTTGSTFQLRTEDIVFLKKQSVSDRVVMAMQNSRLANQPVFMSAPAMPAFIVPTSGTVPVPLGAIELTSPPLWVCPGALIKTAMIPDHDHQVAARFVEFVVDTTTNVLDVVSDFLSGSTTSGDDSELSGRMRFLSGPPEYLRHLQLEPRDSKLKYDRLSGSIGPD